MIASSLHQEQFMELGQLHSLVQNIVQISSVSDTGVDKCISSLTGFVLLTSDVCCEEKAGGT